MDFLKFLSSLDRGSNSSIIESVYLAWSVLFENMDNIFAKHSDKIPDRRIFDLIVESDPTYKSESNQLGKYGNWLLRLHKKGELPEEDLYKAKDYLDVFNHKRYRQHFETKEIDKIKTLPDLYENIKEVFDAVKVGDVDKFLGEKANISKGKTEVKNIYKDGEWNVVTPQTMWGSIAWGTRAQWCTSTKTIKNNRFEYYNKKGPLYIHIKGKGDDLEMYQLHIQEKQFKDISNSDADIFGIGLPETLLDWYAERGIEEAKNMITFALKSKNMEYAKKHSVKFTSEVQDEMLSKSNSKRINNYQFLIDLDKALPEFEMDPKHKKLIESSDYQVEMAKNDRWAFRDILKLEKKLEGFNISEEAINEALKRDIETRNRNASYGDNTRLDTPADEIIKNAVKDGNLERIKRIYSMGYGINDETWGGESLLDLAAFEKDIDIMKYAINSGAVGIFPAFNTFSYMTCPLWKVMDAGAGKLADKLILRMLPEGDENKEIRKRGIDFIVANMKNYVDVAIKSGAIEVLKFLKKLGGDSHIKLERNSSYSNVLSRAIQSGNSKMMKQIMDVLSKKETEFTENGYYYNNLNDISEVKGAEGRKITKIFVDAIIRNGNANKLVGRYTTKSFISDLIKNSKAASAVKLLAYLIKKLDSYDVTNLIGEVADSKTLKDPGKTVAGLISKLNGCEYYDKYMREDLFRNLGKRKTWKGMIAIASGVSDDEELQDMLSYAAQYGGAELVSYLIKEKNAKSKSWPNSPLILAAKNGHKEVVIELLKQLSDPLTADDKEIIDDAEDEAAEQGHSEIIKILSKYDQGSDNDNYRRDSKVGRAASGGHYEVVKQYLRNHPRINAADAMVSGAQAGSIKIVQFLLPKIVEMNTSQEILDKAVVAAVEGGNEEIVEYLLKHGADPNAYGDSIEGSLAYAAAGMGNEEMLKSILSRNPNCFNVLMALGHHPLPWAVKKCLELPEGSNSDNISGAISNLVDKDDDKAIESLKLILNHAGTEPRMIKEGIRYVDKETVKNQPISILKQWMANKGEKLEIRS